MLKLKVLFLQEHLLYAEIKSVINYLLLTINIETNYNLILR